MLFVCSSKILKSDQPNLVLYLMDLQLVALIPLFADHHSGPVMNIIYERETEKESYSDDAYS